MQGRRYVLKREICAGRSTGGAQTASSLATTTNEFSIYSNSQFAEGRPHGPRVRLR